MTNPFQDQYQFMKACDQTVDHQDLKQYQMYCNLIREEFDELCESDNIVDDIDALIDILVVTIGALHSLGADAEGAWNEVMRSNMAKIDPATGKVIKREDGKVLKPPGWQPPQLANFVTRRDKKGWGKNIKNRNWSMTADQWVATLGQSDLDRWLPAHKHHTDMVDRAVAHGAAERESTTDGVTIKWRDEDTHKKYLAELDPEMEATFQYYWLRYIGAMQKLASEQ